MYTDRTIWKLVKTEQIIELLLLSKPQRRGHAAFSPSLRHGKTTWNSLCRETKRRAMKESHKKLKQRKTTEWWLRIHAEHKRCTRLGWFCFVRFVGDWTWRDTVIWLKVIIISLSEFQYLKRFGKTQTRCTCARRVDRQVWSSFQSAGVWILADSGYENDVQKKYWSTFLQYFLCWAISWGRWWWDPTSISILKRFWTFKDRGHTSQCCRASQWDGWGRWAVGSCTWTCNEFGRGLVEVQITKVYLNSYLVFSIGRLAQLFFLLVLVLVMKTCQAASQWARHVELTRWTPCHWMPCQPFGPGGVNSVQSCSSSPICLATGFFQMQKANEVTRYDDLWLWHDTYHRIIIWYS